MPQALQTDLTFDEAGHVYRFRGHVVPSVTQVLDILNDFSAVHPEKLAAAAQFGRHVHAACDLVNRGELDRAGLDPGLLDYVTQYERFLLETGFIVTASEQRVFNSLLRYAGTVDLVGEWQGTTWLVDIKTGSVPRSVGAQTAAYQQALDPRPRKRLVLKLTGIDYRLTECKDLSDFSLFTSCLNVWRHLNVAA